jgi:hypothetical protein
MITGKSIDLAYGFGTITNQTKGAAALFASTIAGSSFGTALKVIGALVVFVSVAVILIRKFWPNSPLGSMVQGSSIFVWVTCGILLGVTMFAPATILPIVGVIVGIVPDVAVWAASKLFPSIGL